MGERKINVQLAKSGMQITQPIYDYGKTLLLPVKTVLTSKKIAQLKFCGIDEIWIEDNGLITEDIYQDIYMPKYIEEIKHTEEFVRFDRAHQKSVEEVKEALNAAILNNQEIDVNNLLCEVDFILQGAQNGIHVFDMLQCIRVYDDSTYVHSVNVALICNVMGRWLHLKEEDIRILTLCGLLHDVGKLLMPPEIIKKAGKLTHTEYETIKKHPLLGYSILEKENLDPRIKLAAYQHHEKCDGSGYPNGLLGHEIDSFAKIVTIADIYDAMTANRVYREGLCPFDVIEIFEQEGLRKYEPLYLLTFLQHIAESYINKPVQLSNAQQGQVIMLNQHVLSRPVVRVEEQYIDLSKTTELSIKKIL
ncbi:MAG: HD-GYP domain-containing protein [Cellulosilyticum sp.]|nr:HD-GYP domain-containing protein [Cellulosilyticum sp.]